MSAELIQHLRFHGRFGNETEEQAKLRRVQRNEAAATELERLAAELAAARVDAERYRWLRDDETSDWAICEWDHGSSGYYRDARAAKIVDAAIDAARQAG